MILAIFPDIPHFLQLNPFGVAPLRVYSIAATIAGFDMNFESAFLNVMIWFVVVEKGVTSFLSATEL